MSTKVKPDLSFMKLFNLSFGFFGVQIAYALQSANVSRDEIGGSYRMVCNPSERV